MRNQAEVAELAKTTLKTIIEKKYEDFKNLFQENVRLFAPEASVFNDIANKISIIFPTVLDVDACQMIFLKAESIQNVSDIDLYSYECTVQGRKITIFLGLSSLNVNDNALLAFYVQPNG